MSIKLSFAKGSLAIQVTLKDDALPSLLEIVAAHQSDEATAAAPATFPTQATAQAGAIAMAQSATRENNSGAAGWLKEAGPAGALSVLGWDTGPEKILVVAAYHEAASGSDEAWRSSDMETRFREAREQFPSNFSRDIGNAIKQGWIITVTPRTYRVSRTGWNRIDAASKAHTPITSPELYSNQ